MHFQAWVRDDSVSRNVSGRSFNVSWPIRHLSNHIGPSNPITVQGCGSR